MAERDEQQWRRASARIEPSWLNPATIKGIVAIALGGFVLFAPTFSARLISLMVGAGLVVSGVSDIWFTRRERTWPRVLEALLSVAAGLLFAFLPTETARALAVVGGVYLLVRGGSVVSASLRQRSAGEEWGADLSRGLLQTVAGVVAVILPESVVEGVLLGAAALVAILGAIMLAQGLAARDDEELVDLDAATVFQLVVKWIRSRDVGGERRHEIGETLFFEQPERSGKLTSWWVMLLLSVAIATFGILQDSTAVVIGAMLIAPLMTPILGASAGIVNVWPRRVGASLALIVAGVAASIALAWIVGAWTPAIVPLDVNTQVTSRTSPNMVDMMIALAAGAAGAYATVDRRVSSSIAGVAIAVALVPPLGVVGVTLNAGMIDEGLGAFLLFVTNLVSIVLSASLVFFLTGYAPFRRLEKSGRTIGALVATVLTIALVILVPLVFTGDGVMAASARQRASQAAVSDWLADQPELRATRIEIDDDQVAILLVGVGEIPPIEPLEDSLAATFEEPVTIIVVYTPTLIVRYSDAEGRTELAPQD